MTVAADSQMATPSLGRFLVQLIWGRWFMMFGALLIMAGAGGTYLFGVYSQEIKATFGYDQSTLNLMGTFKDLGANVGVLSGLIAEVTPVWFVLLLGSLMNFTGYFMIWLSLTGKIAKPKVWQMCLYICIGANSQNFANTGSLVTCVKNFPESRGMMLGLLKGYVGLSGAVFTQLYHAIYGDDAKSLVLLIGWFPGAISLIFIFIMRIMKVGRRHPREVTVFYYYLYISIGLALSAMALTIAQKGLRFSHVAYILSATLVCFWLFLPLVIAMKEEYIDWKTVKHPNDSAKNIESNEQATKETGDPKDDKEKKVTCFMDICDKPTRGEDYTILQALLSADMIILFVATLCGLGCSLTAVDNMGQIGLALGYPARTISTFVSLISIWNYFGRVFAGFGSEILLTKYKIPRPLIMSIALFLSSIGDILIAFPFNGSVYLASLLIGFAFGAQLTLLFTIISELFGLKTRKFYKGDIYKKFRDQSPENKIEMGVTEYSEGEKSCNQQRL
ncbi:hypothetical protein Cgig2_016743 [Carnegiea gigantea]|uniref:Nodulin-like domain-containing protein n=1 Tax=Carnegiea gigantea TaxID=171969 RepID=A0A9Q1L111_9CARY|nr:hypothetical protein Cgig2_016743 [Carnegiea gigantea]